MDPHVHVGPVDFLKTFCYLVIIVLLWRVAAAHIARKHPAVAAGMTGVLS